MHDVLRQRLIRRIESLPDAQVYEVLDYIEFLESKYSGDRSSGDLAEEASTLQRFAEKMEDRLRRKAMNPATLREAFQLIAAADRALSGVTSAGRQLLQELSFSGGSDSDVPDANAFEETQGNTLRDGGEETGPDFGAWP